MVNRKPHLNNIQPVDFDGNAKGLMDGMKSELELVKAELATIKANQLSGDQKVQLSGTIETEYANRTNQQEIITELRRMIPSKPANDYSKSPGGKVILAGDSQAGFYGFIQPEEFGEIDSNPEGKKEFNGSNLGLALGISQGASQFSTTPWMKFSSNGRIIFTPLKAIRHSVTWNTIYNAGAVYGDDSVGVLPPNGRMGTQLTIDGSDNSINTTTNSEDAVDGFLKSSTVAASVSDTVVLSGFTNEQNNGEFTVISITANKIVLSGGTLVTEVGSETGKIYAKKYEVVQNARISVNGLQYRVRLMRGAGSDPLDSYSNSDRGLVGNKSEWNRLILPLHERAKAKNWLYPEYAGEVTDWGVGLSDLDLITHYTLGSGSYSWCQETRDGEESYRRVVRGNYGASSGGAGFSWGVSSGYAFRPVLELL